MASVLFCWELGAGLGHVVPLLTLADDLASEGHRVTFALRQTDKLGGLLSARGHAYMQAPIPGTREAPVVRTPCSYPHVLFNSGYSDAYGLLGSIRSWRALFHHVNADVVVCEHAPSALLAARGLGIKSVIIGNGFTIPPEIYPLPNLRPWLDVDTKRLQRDEDQVCATINRALTGIGAPQLDRISDLFRTTVFLRTLKELDPYERDASVEYWGTSVESSGPPAIWPQNMGPRVFAYLRPSNLFDAVLSHLAAMRISTLVVSPGIPSSVKKRYESSTLRISAQPLNMQDVLGGCEVAILNATLNSVISFLLAGKPMLLLPLALEHLLTARKVQHAGAGIDLSNIPNERIGEVVQLGLRSETHLTAAQGFAQRYAQFDADKVLGRLRERLLKVVAA